MPEQALVRKRRLACDRCNSLKLRCPKTPESSSCVRCQKAAAECVFSPSRRGLRPPRGNEPITQPQRGYELNGIPSPLTATRMNTYMDSDFNADFLESMQGVGFTLPNSIDVAPIQDRNPNLTIPSFPLAPDYSCGPITDEGANVTNLLSEPTVPAANFMSLLEGTHTDSWDQNTPVPNPSVASNEATAISQEETPDAKNLPVSTQIAQQLAKLSIDLGKHAATIPPLAVHDRWDAYATFSAETTDNVSITSTEGKPFFSLQKTFQLTQTLVNLYPRLTKTNIGVSTSTRPFNFNATSPAVVDDSSRSTRNPTTSSTSREILDHALVLQLLSCHHRVTDTWDLIFSHVHKAIETGKIRLKFGENSPCQGLVHIGNFIPTTKVPMEIVLSLEFFRQLLNQAQQLVEHISSLQHIDERTANDSIMEGGIPTISDSNTEATKNAGMAVVSRAAELVRKACHIRSLIEKQNNIDT